MKAIKEVTYYCKQCDMPLADELILVDCKMDPKHEDYIKTGNLICPKCHKRFAGNIEYIQL